MIPETAPQLNLLNSWLHLCKQPHAALVMNLPKSVVCFNSWSGASGLFVQVCDWIPPLRTRQPCPFPSRSCLSELPVAFNNTMLYNTIRQCALKTLLLSCSKAVQKTFFFVFFNVPPVSADFHSDFWSFGDAAKSRLPLKIAKQSRKLEGNYSLNGKEELQATLASCSRWAEFSFPSHRWYLF